MRLIDADALSCGLQYAIKNMEKSESEWMEGYKEGLDTVRITINEAPTIEAEPVKHSKPLTLEELRQMHGKVVWIEQEKTYGIVTVDKAGEWEGKPFVTFYYGMCRCDWNIELRGLTCYHYEPVKHGRWEEYPSPRFLRCSVCKCEYEKSRMPLKHVGWCPNPNCGAKMDL